MGKLMSKGSEGQNLPYIPDTTLAQLTVKELNKKVRQMEIQVMIQKEEKDGEQRNKEKDGEQKRKRRMISKKGERW